jgi:hypothetical protein
MLALGNRAFCLARVRFWASGSIAAMTGMGAQSCLAPMFPDQPNASFGLATNHLSCQLPPFPHFVVQLLGTLELR